MAWSTPRTWFAGEYVTSDYMNAQIRDNFNVLATPYDTATGKIQALSLTYFASLAPHIMALKSTLTSVSNSGAIETNLMITALLAGQISANKMGLRVTAWGTTTNSANAKTVTSYLLDSAPSSTVLGGGFAGMLTNSQANRWQYEAMVLRTGASAGTAFWNFKAGPTNAADTTHGEKSVATTQNWALVCSIVTNGTGGASNEVTQLAQVVEIIYQ